MGVSKRSNKPKRFTGIPKIVHESEEWAQLSPTEKALLIDIWSQYNGFNNGDLSAALTLLSKKGWRNQGTVSRTVRSLMKKNFFCKQDDHYKGGVLYTQRHGNE